MGMVNNNKYAAEVTEDQGVQSEGGNQEEKVGAHHGDKASKVEDIVKPAGEKELEEVKRLKEEKEMLMQKDEESLATEELEEEIKKSKEEYENVMKRPQLMRQQQVGGIEETCEIMHTMCLDVNGYMSRRWSRTLRNWRTKRRGLRSLSRSLERNSKLLRMKK